MVLKDYKSFSYVTFSYISSLNVIIMAFAIRLLFLQFYLGTSISLFNISSHVFLSSMQDT